MTESPGRRGTKPILSSGHVRVAIYTRKSTEEGLDQEFNSLEAQRESVEAYVQSQKSEGWSALPTKYDDGGFTGANTDRPAFQQLLQDVQTHRVDVVAVYKIDRLSRSLTDFTRTIDLFEKHNVTFVSVTQQFNTTTSMGRLTLNILMSFAEFERQVNSERTRDKMAASRRKGLWTGGRVVLGYNAIDKRLVINETEAEQVREIFRLYLKVSGLIALVEEVQKRGWRTKGFRNASGALVQGRLYDKHSLGHLLRNYIYIGKIFFKGNVYNGAQPRIVEQQLWDAVQQKFEAQTHKARKERNRWFAPLKGLLACCVCSGRMTTHYTKKNGHKSFYYMCLKQQKQGVQGCPSKLVPARKMEAFIAVQMRKRLNERLLNYEANSERTFNFAQLNEIVERMILDRNGATLAVRFREDALKTLNEEAQREVREADYAIQWETDFFGKVQTDLLRTDGTVQSSCITTRTSKVARHIALAYKLRHYVDGGRLRNSAHCAQILRITRARVSQLLSFVHLSPSIQETILLAKESFRISSLKKIASVPSWKEQRIRLQQIRNSSTQGATR